MKICGKTHQYCGVCGKSWHLCADPTFGTDTTSRQVQWSYTAGWEADQEWDNMDWNSQDQSQASWTKSPRRRQTPRRRSNRRTGPKTDAVNGQAGKGKGKDHGVTPPLGPPALPSLSPAETPWLTPLMAVPPPIGNPPAQSAEDKQMKTIMTMLKKHNDTLPPELQALVNDALIKDGQIETKQLHSAVAAHGRARRDLQQAQLAHFHLHSAWRGFLTQAVSQWKSYSEQFADQEKQLTDRVQKAAEALAQAKETLAKTKSLAGVENREEAMSEDDTEKAAKEVNITAADKIKEGITNLHTSLDALRSTADQMVEEEQKALKRPRLEPKTGDSSNGSTGDGTSFG